MLDYVHIINFLLLLLIIIKSLHQLQIIIINHYILYIINLNTEPASSDNHATQRVMYSITCDNPLV